MGRRLHSSNLEPLMSALGQKRTFRGVRAMSALPPKADIRCRDRYVRFVPKADILRCGKERRYSMTLSARANSVAETMMPNAPGLSSSDDCTEKAKRT